MYLVDAPLVRWLLLIMIVTKWFVEHVLTFEHLQQMDAILSYITRDMVIYKLVFCPFGCCRWSYRDLEGVWVYILDGFGLSQSSETACFQFWAVAEMIRLSLPFWCSFTILDGLSKQRDDFLGSPRALYEEGGVQPLDCTILAPSQRAWLAQLDNAGNLGGSFWHISFLEADKK